MTSQPAVGPILRDETTGLAYRLRQPLPAAPRGVVVLLHGIGGHESNLADVAAGFAPDVAVVLPRGALQLAAGQYAWFRVTFAPGGPAIVEAEAEASRVLLIRFVERMQAQFGMDRARTLIAGFSQGGVMSASVGLSAPECVAGFATLSGRILPELEPRLAPRELLAKLTVLIAHGRSDAILPVSWAERADRWLTELGVPHRTRLYPAGHEVNQAMREDFIAWAGSSIGATASAGPRRREPGAPT